VSPYGLRIERTGPGGVVARVTLARPEVRNAFNAELIASLTEAFAALGEEPPNRLRAVILAGDGPVFCAGADINWQRAARNLSLQENEADAGRLHDMLLAVDRCPVSVVARVHGAALGGGMGLLTTRITGFSERRSRSATSWSRGARPACASTTNRITSASAMATRAWSWTRASMCVPGSSSRPPVSTRVNSRPFQSPVA